MAAKRVDGGEEAKISHPSPRRSQDDIVVRKPSREKVQLQQELDRASPPRRTNSPPHSVRGSSDEDESSSEPPWEERLPTTAKKMAERERRAKERSLPASFKPLRSGSIQLLGFSFDVDESSASDRSPSRHNKPKRKKGPRKITGSPGPTVASDTETDDSPSSAKAKTVHSEEKVSYPTRKSPEAEEEKSKRRTIDGETKKPRKRFPRDIDGYGTDQKPRKPRAESPKFRVDIIPPTGNPSSDHVSSGTNSPVEFRIETPTAVPAGQAPHRKSGRGADIPRLSSTAQPQRNTSSTSDSDSETDFPVKRGPSRSPSPGVDSSEPSDAIGRLGSTDSFATGLGGGLGGGLSRLGLGGSQTPTARQGVAALFESLFKSNSFGFKKHESKWCGIHLDFLVPQGLDMPPMVEHVLSVLSKRASTGFEVHKAFSLLQDPLKVVQSYPQVANVTAALSLDDPATMASVLIAFLAFLPDSVCTNRLLEGFLQTLDIEREDYQTNCFHSLVHALPPNHYTLFKAIITFIKSVGAKNEEAANHLAAVFGPVVFRPKLSDEMVNTLLGMTKRGRRLSDGDPSSARSTGQGYSTESSEGFSDEEDFKGRSGSKEKDDDGHFGQRSTARTPTSPTPAGPRNSPTLKHPETISEDDDGQKPTKRLTVPTAIDAPSTSPRTKGGFFPATPKKGEEDSRLAGEQLIQVFVAHFDKYFADEVGGCRYSLHKGRVVVKTASADGLIEKLLDEYYKDPDFLQLFVDSGHLFIAPEQLLEGLTLRFYETGEWSSTMKEWQKKRRLRILSVIRTWAQARADDLLLQPKFVSMLKEFLARTKDRFKDEETILSDVMNTLFLPGAKIVKSIGEVAAASIGEAEPVTALHTVPVEVVAQQMALLDAETFRSIRSRECYNKAYSDPKRGPNFMKMTSDFNKLALHVQSQIVTPALAKDRADIAVFYLQLASKCVDLNHFNAALAIFSGLTSSAVSRMGKTWERVNKNKRGIKCMTNLMHLFSMDKNQKNYRDRLAECALPIIPYIGMYTKFIAAVEENNEDKVNGLLNLEKLRDLFAIVKDMSKYQKSLYQYPKNNLVLAYLANLPVMKEEEIYAQSLKLEPRKPAASTPT